MSSSNEPARRMSTRGFAKEKIAKVMDRVRSGGIVEENPTSKEGVTNGGESCKTAMDATIPSARKKAKTAKAANKTEKADASKKSGKTKKSNITDTAGATKKSSAPSFKDADATTKKALIARLAELEDRLSKKQEAAQSSHPRRWTGGNQGNYTPSRVFTDKIDNILIEHVIDAASKDPDSDSNSTHGSESNKGSHQPKKPDTRDNGE